jgi:phosphatidylcholine synthase
MSDQREGADSVGRSGWHLAAAIGVHVLTALGIVCALLATLAALQGAWERTFVWLGIAVVVDGIDGTFARLVDVARRLPRFSGERLDQVIDYVTYVFVPALVLFQAGFLRGWSGLVLGSLLLLSSLFHFCDLDNKADDHSFVGFPAVWNIVAFYLFAFAVPAWLAAAVILLCAALTFVPMRWVHPLRVVELRTTTVALTLLWAAAAVWTLWLGFPAGPVAQLVFAGVGLYVVALALTRPWSRPGANAT